MRNSRRDITRYNGPELSAVWVVKADTFYCEVLEAKREELEAMITRLRQPFKDVKERKTLNLCDVGFDLKLAKRLYEQIFRPAGKYLEENSSLILVPDGVLHYLPFEALVTGIEKKRHDPKVCFSRYKNAHYLLEKYALTYVPAASILAVDRSTCAGTEDVGGRFLGFGRPDFGRFTEVQAGDEDKPPTAVTMSMKASKGLIFAPLSGRDVHEVAQLMQPASIFLGKEATEGRFKQEAGKFANLYLSTHGIVSETQPMYSLIAFAQNHDPAEDGFLHTYEVFNLCLNADLVTLSACETGLGKLSRGEGLIGLTRAFMYAGTPSVVVSLWSVDESTATIMKLFYQNLISGMTKSKALQQAKLRFVSMREGGMSFAHPFLWAPFVLMGKGR